MPEPQIVAIGGFSEVAPPGPLYPYLLGLCQRERPRFSLLATASGDAPGFIDRFYEQTDGLDCEPRHFGLFGAVEDPDTFFLETDILMVGGGNTRSLLALWREWGIDGILRRRWQEGMILAGFSAGAICWFEGGVTDSWAGPLRAIQALGFLPGSFCPHYDSEGERGSRYRALLQDGELAAGFGVEDGMAVHYRGREPRALVRFSDGGNAFRVSAEGEAPADLDLVDLFAS